MPTIRWMSLASRRSALGLSLAALALGQAGCGKADQRSADAAGAGAAAPQGLAAGGGSRPGTLSGVIELQPGLGVDPARFDSVFVMLRHDPAQNATDFVRRIQQPRFPLAFEITSTDSMIGPAPLSGSYQVTARLDADGDAKAGLGDVQGIAGSLAEAGGAPIALVLNQVLTGDGQPPHAAPMAGGSAAAPFAGGAAATEASPAERAAAEAGPHIDGKVDIDPAFAELAGRGRLYVSVSSAQSQGGMPIAVVPVDAPQFPVAFHITTLDIPLQVDNKADMLAGQLKIKARLSLSGNALPAPGDVECEPQVILAGGDPVTLRLTRRRAP